MSVFPSSAKVKIVAGDMGDHLLQVKQGIRHAAVRPETVLIPALKGKSPGFFGHPIECLPAEIGVFIVIVKLIYLVLYGDKSSRHVVSSARTLHDGRIYGQDDCITNPIFVNRKPGRMQSIDELKEIRYSYLRITQDGRNWSKKRRDQKRKQGRQDSDNSAAWDFVCCLLSGIFFAGKIFSFPKRAGGNPSLPPDFNRTILEFSSRTGLCLIFDCHACFRQH